MFPFKSESFTISLHYCLCFCVISYLLLLGDLIAQIKVDKVNTILNSTYFCSLLQIAYPESPKEETEDHSPRLGKHQIIAQLTST